MILRRSFLNELGNSAGGVFTVIFSIVLTVGLVNVMHATAGGRFDTAAVFEIMIYTGLSNLPPLMAASVFIAVLIVMIRAWQDSEMVVWYCAAGRSLLDWIPPVLKFVLPIAVLVAVLSVSVSPWAKAQIQQSAKSFQQRDDVSRVAPGRFIETSGGRRVFFVEEMSEGGERLKNVFMNINEGNREILVESVSGEIKTNAMGDRYVVLGQGRRYDTSAKNDAAWRVIEFKTYEVRLDSKINPLAVTSDVDKVPFSMLWLMKSPYAKSQLLWRLSWPLVTVILALMAIPLSCTNTRAGRNLNLVLAALVFILYLNGISIVVAWVKTARLGWIPGLILVNGVFALLTVLLFVRRVWMQRWLPAYVTDAPFKIVRTIRRRRRQKESVR